MTDQTQVERAKFITDLLAEVDGFDEQAFLPPYEIEKGDKKLGEISLWLRKMYALMRFYARECKRQQVEIEFDPTAKKDHSGCIAYSRMKYKHDVLNEMFWACLRDEMNAWHEASVGVRTGWIAVESKEEPQKAKFKEFLGGIFGGTFPTE